MRKYWAILIILIGFHLFFLTQLRFTAWPEMLSFPYLRNNGYLLYIDMVHAYPPLLTMGLSLLYKLFGYHIWVLQAVTWGMLIFNDILIYLVSKKISKSEKGALISVGAYIALQPFLEGNQLWFDIAITTPLLLGFLSIIHKKYLVAAFLICIAAFTKQTGGLFFIAYFAWLIFSKKKVKEIAKVALMPLLFIVPLGLRLIQEGAVQGFWNWVIVYPSKFWTKFPGYVDMHLGRREIIILLLIILPSVVLLLKKKAWLLLLFCIIGLVSIYPRFSFFHFQTALPFFAISYSFLNIANKKSLVVMFVAVFIIAEQYIYKPTLVFEWQKPTRFWSAQEEIFAKDLPQNQSVYLLGFHSGYYALSHALPPKPWIDNYPWVFEIPGIQENAIEKWQQNPPEFIIWQPSLSGNWYDIGTYQPKKVVEWIKQNYSQKTQILWQKND